MRGGCSPVARQPSDVASMPLTQRAFRSPAGARVTFLLLAQKKSNPKKTASRAGSTPWDRSAGRFARANSWSPTARHSGYTATRRSGEDLRRVWPTVEAFAVAACLDGNHTAHALSPLRLGALRCSRCVSPWAAPYLSDHARQARIPRNAMSFLGHFLWVTFLLGQQKKSDSAAGRQSKRPLRKRHPSETAQLSRNSKHPPPSQPSSRKGSGARVRDNLPTTVANTSRPIPDARQESAASTLRDPENQAMATLSGDGMAFADSAWGASRRGVDAS